MNSGRLYKMFWINVQDNKESSPKSISVFIIKCVLVRIVGQHFIFILQKRDNEAYEIVDVPKSQV